MKVNDMKLSTYFRPNVKAELNQSNCSKQTMKVRQNFFAGEGVGKYFKTYISCYTKNPT